METGADRTGDAILAQPGADAPTPLVWKDFSRYVEVHPVQTGWLVLWGRYEEQGKRKILFGNRTYTTLEGARRRFADAALELTRKPALVTDALMFFDRFPFPDHRPKDLPDPL
ncbi:MAG: hypothetical protein M3Q71_24400 [Chloroflexota bacterium]|nr:hypothetical protein [Chloroflexota bacterium]MDP9473764.1 hypothetical protein [Chloroflexota bacterium]